MEKVNTDNVERLYRHALRLEYFTVTYNILEAVASLVAGGIANSIALIGFGLDSMVESLSGFVMIWRLKKHNTISEEEEERIEEKAERFVGITFFILGGYILYESINKMVIKEIPDPSLPGMIIAALSIIIMPLLAYRKFRIGQALNLKSLVADSKETLVCSFMSVALLLGLSTRYFFGFWLSDPIAGVVIVLFLFKEGFELVFEKKETPGI